MRRLTPKTFFGQLVLGTVLVQTLFLGLFTWYITVNTRQSSQERSRERTFQQLDRLAEACANHLAHNDTVSTQEVLNLSRISTTVDIARLTDLAGHTLAVSDNGQSRQLYPSELSALPTATHQQQIFKIDNGQLEAVGPIVVQGKPVALLWLEPNRAASLNTLSIVLRICVSYGGFALLANLLPIFLIVRTMTRPLQNLREATHRIIRDPASKAGFPLPVTTTNEAGELTASFNAMVQELTTQRSGLLETLALLDSMLGNAPIGFAFFDRDLRYMRINDFLAHSHGVSVADHDGRRVPDFYPAEFAREKERCIEQVFATGEPIRDIELSGHMPSDPTVKRSWIMQFYPVRTQQDNIKWVGVIVVEITDRIRSEDALRKNEKLAAAGRLAASIAHEINNPLEAVTNLLYLLATHEPMDIVASSMIHTAQAELARVSEITQQTLRFYRQSTHPALTNVAEVINSVLALYNPRIVSARVTLRKQFRGEPLIFGFGGELRQLFANFIGNALDAMPEGGRLHLRLRPGSGHRADGLWCHGTRVTVSDSGSGMSPDTMKHIFEAFFTTKQVTGTGLGLWVSDEIVRKHHGSVRLRSRQSHPSGTTFTLFFPDHPPEPDPTAALTATHLSPVSIN
jgi:signal transduction histidine kinase/HAMP domain-containing protein